MTIRNRTLDFFELAAIYPASTSNLEIGRLSCLAAARGYRIFDVYAEPDRLLNSPRARFNQLLNDATNHCFAAVIFSGTAVSLHSDAEFHKGMQHLLDEGVRCFAFGGVVWEARRRPNDWVWVDKSRP